MFRQGGGCTDLLELVHGRAGPALNVSIDGVAAVVVVVVVVVSLVVVVVGGGGGSLKGQEAGAGGKRSQAKTRS